MFPLTPDQHHYVNLQLLKCIIFTITALEMGPHNMYKYSDVLLLALII